MTNLTSRDQIQTASGMIANLNRFVRGQNRAKQDISVAVYSHYLSQAYRQRPAADPGRHRILPIVPTGACPEQQGE